MKLWQIWYRAVRFCLATTPSRALWLGLKAFGLGWEDQERLKGDLWYLYTNYPKFDRNFRVIIEDKYIELQNRLLQTFSSTAYERYESFLEQYPKLANRLPNTQIASYLGITPEFLSKIRNERVVK